MASDTRPHPFVGSLLLAGALLWPVPAIADEATRPFVDSAGRTVQVPVKVARVYAAGHPATIFLYTLAPETLLGWTTKQPERTLALLPPRYADLPVLGRLTGRGDTANVEVVLKTRPDLIFDFGTVRPTYASLADRVQNQTGIPYVLVDGTFAGIPAAYRMMGKLIGAEDRGERLARYAEALLAEVEAVLAAVPAHKRPRVYYGRGPDGFETGRLGSINVEMIDLVGAVNVAAAAGKGGLAKVSIEQILGWNPDTILTTDPHFFGTVAKDARWRGIRAVATDRVFLAPEYPFGWFDRPPSVNRLIGIRWLLNLLYPNAVKRDLRDAVGDFYDLFYHRRPSAAELDALLATAGAR